MKLSKKEFAELLGVTEKYLCPSNFNHYKKGAEERGYNLLSRTGVGKNVVFEIEPIPTENE